MSAHVVTRPLGDAEQWMTREVILRAVSINEPDQLLAPRAREHDGGFSSSPEAAMYEWEVKYSETKREGSRISCESWKATVYAEIER